MIANKDHIHFIAIGGSAMHNLAIALKEAGHIVTGSDDEIFEPSRTRLSKHGLLPEKSGWHPDKITNDTGAVILGMHARADNPELLKAQKLHLPVYSFPDFVYETSKDAKRVVIAGSHGKTTITSMIMHVLNFCNKNFDYLAGAGVAGFENTVRLSHAPLMVLEGDEYFSSVLDKTPKFLRYNHSIGLISGIAWDHINAFPTREDYIQQFRKFIEHTPEEGHLIYCKDDALLDELIKEKSRDFNVIPYATPDYEVRNGKYYLKTRKGEVPVKFFGKHNMQNAAGAIAVLKLLGIPENEILASLSSFGGAANRLEKLYDENGMVVYKDFAHSPSKLRSTISAVHELYPDSKIIACFELHTYSSLNKDFLNEYRDAFRYGNIKIVFVNDHTFKIKKMHPLSDADIRQGFGNENIVIVRKITDLQDLLEQNIKPETVYLFMSSGNFGGLDYAEFIAHIKENQSS